METSFETLERENLLLKQKVESHEAYIEKLEEELRLFIERRFGRSSEVYVDPNQSQLFNEIETDTKTDDEQEAEEEDPRAAKPKRRGGRKPLPSILPRKQIVHDLPEEDKLCQEHGVELKKIGEDVSE